MFEDSHFHIERLRQCGRYLSFETIYTDEYYGEHSNFKKIAFLKKELKNKRLNPALRVQYSRELSKLDV